MGQVQRRISGPGKQWRLLGLAIALSACTAPTSTPVPSPKLSSSTTPSTTPIAPSPQAIQPTRPSPPTRTTTPKPSPPTTTVLLYRVDRQCLTLVPEKVVLPIQGSLDQAIARIIATWDNADFNLAGHRVKTANGIATIDFRLEPGAQRQLASLSSCEQLGLLGSIRKTLTANSQWQIQTVEFTQQGQALQ